MVFFIKWTITNFLKLGVFNQVLEVNTVIRLLDHVADYTIEKNCHGLVQDLPGEVKSLAGEE